MENVCTVSYDFLNVKKSGNRPNIKTITTVDMEKCCVIQRKFGESTPFWSRNQKSGKIPMLCNVEKESMKSM